MEEQYNVKAGVAAPWVDEPGDGIQYLLPDTIEALLQSSVIRRIER